MKSEEYGTYDATGLAGLIASGAASPREVVIAAVARLEETNPAINAVIERDVDRAMASLDDLPAGPLRGVPWLVKDLNTTAANLHDTNGSRVLVGPVAEHDSELVARHRRAGLVVLGKTNSPEFGMNVCTNPTRYGPTRHPLDPTRSVGGSSGGAAAAVAAGILPAAHATDSGGSIRIPASNCGLFGLKPTRNRVPLGNDASEGLAGLSTAHALTYSVRDSALLLDITHGPLAGDVTSPPGPPEPFVEAMHRSPGSLRVGLVTEGFAGEFVHPSCVAAVQGAASTLETLGHHIEPIASPIDGQVLRASLDVVFRVNIALLASTLGEPGAVEASLEPATRAAVARASRLSGVDYVAAQMAMRQISAQLDDAFGRVDVMLTPTLAHPSRPIGYHDPSEPDWRVYLDRMLDDIAFTPLFNVSGGPAMSVPLGADDTGLPVGVQIGAAPGQEARLLAIARQLELAAPWHDRI